MGVVKKYLLITIISFFTFFSVTEYLSAQAQITEREIKLSGNYRYGEGFAESREAARNNAKQDLLQGIQVFISTETELIEVERGSDVISDYRSNVRVQSQMQIEGLSFYEDERRDGTRRAIAYISNEDFENTIQTLRRRMFLKLENALHFENSNNYNRAIALYYEIFAESPGLPIRLFTDPDEHGVELELQQFARNKLVEWLNGINIEVDGIRDRSGNNNVELYIKLKLHYMRQPVEYLDVRLNRHGYGAQTVENGEVELFYDLSPENITENITIRLAINPPQLMIPEDSQNIAEIFRPERNRVIRVDFSEVIEIDFEIEPISDNHYRFIPKPVNLSVTNVEWNFGDGNRTTDTQPTHTYLNMRQPRQVTLRLNRSPELEVIKTIQPSGNIIRVENPRAHPIDREAGYFVPFHQREYIQRIAGMRNYQALQSYIQRMIDGKVLTGWGAPDKVRVNHSYIIITDPETENVEAILSPVRFNARFDVMAGDVVRYGNDEWMENFRGYRPIFIQF